jgi:hypothetical protein
MSELSEHLELREDATPQEIAEACSDILDQNTCLAIAEEEDPISALELAFSALTEAGTTDPDRFLTERNILSPSKDDKETPLSHPLQTSINELGRGQMINLLKGKGIETNTEGTPVTNLDRDELDTILSQVAMGDPNLARIIFTLAEHP